MSLIVQKYGGTSVGTGARIREVSTHIARTAAAGNRVVAVVSAMGDQTDDLLDLAAQLNPNPPQREVDMLISVGERITMSLISIALHAQNFAALSLTGSQSGILTDAVHGNARIVKILGDRIRQGLESNHIVIVAGFQGMSHETKEITTLGRGGTDLSAIALAHALKADLCEIYKDVDGVFTADPRIVKDARVLQTMTWDALVELTWAGSSVVHSRGAHLAEKFSIPITIRSSFDWNQPGTKVSERLDVESISVTSLAHKRDQCCLEMSAKHNDIVPLALTWLWQRGETPAIVQQSKGVDGLNEVRVVVAEKLAADLVNYLRTQDDQLSLRRERKGLATVTAVGSGFWQSPETLAKITDALNSMPIELFDSRNTAVTVCVGAKDLEACLGSLHTALF